MPATPAKTLLSPDNHSLLLIDHQYLQMLTIRSHEASELINNAVALVEAAAIFDVPLLTTTAFSERQGLVAPLAEASKAVKPIDRTTLNSWEDQRIVDWVEKTGRKKLVIAGQWTEICVAMPVLSALEAGYEVYVVTDACGGASREAHEMAVERMLQAGARPITTWVYVSELQRDWARAETAEKVTKLFAQRGGAFGQGLLWEWDLLALKEGTR
jgi:nicotinamidase-related amidase